MKLLSSSLVAEIKPVWTENRERLYFCPTGWGWKTYRMLGVPVARRRVGLPTGMKVTHDA